MNFKKALPMSHKAANQQADETAVERLKIELIEAFSAPETSYKPLTAGEVISRNRPRTDWRLGENLQDY